MAEAFCRAAEHGCCGGTQQGQGLTHQQPGMMTHGLGKTGTAWSWALQSSVPCGHQHGLASLQGSRDWPLAQLPLTLLGVPLCGKVFQG